MFRDDVLSQPCSCGHSPGYTGPENWRAQLRLVQVTQIYVQSGPGVVMGMAASVITAIALSNQMPKWLLLGWVATVLIVQSVRLLSFRSFRKTQTSSAHHAVQTYERRFLAGSVVTSLLWGTGAAVFFPLVDPDHQLLLAVIVAGVGASMAWAHAPVRKCYVSSVILSVSPLSAYLMFRGDLISVASGIAGFLYIAALLATGRAAHAMFEKSIRLRFEKDRLLERLEQSSRELENAVKERTGELSSANEELRREIRERTVVQYALRDSEEQLSKAQQIARVGSWGLDLPHERLTWSSEMFRILEVDPEASEPSLAILLDRVHPDDATLVEQVNGDLVANGNEHTTEYRLVMPDGRIKHVRSKCEVAYDEKGIPIRAFGALQDVTELRTTEASLYVMEVALDHVAEATYLFDAETRFRYVNQSACRLMGCTKEELLGGSLTQADAAHFVDNWYAYWPRLTKQKALSFEGVHRNPDGRDIPVEVTAISFEYKGVPYYWAFVRDITERKRAQEEGLAWERSVSESQKLESLGALAGGIAHDFNNLLTAILGNLELALADPLMSSHARTRLQRAVAASQRAEAITRQMLAYSGKGQFVLAKVNLSQLLKEDLALWEGSLVPSAELSMNLDSDVPSIEADPDQLRQLVGNLIANASEALDTHPQRISLATGFLHCDESILSRSRLGKKLRPGPFVYVQVSDTGRGMDEITSKRMFDPFFSTKFMGRGLGMAEVMGIVRGHGGAIIVDSIVGEGTRVRALFPVAEISLEQAPADVKPGKTSDEASCPGVAGTLLLIDDEAFVRDVCKEMLEHCGFNVLCAADGFEGLEVLKRHESSIDCIILDLCMPGKNGLVALSEIRLLRSDVKVILCSGYNAQEAALRFEGMGLDGFLQKPFHMQTLIARVNEIVARKK